MNTHSWFGKTLLELFLLFPTSNGSYSLGGMISNIPSLDNKSNPMSQSISSCVLLHIRPYCYDRQPERQRWHISNVNSEKYSLIPSLTTSRYPCCCFERRAGVIRPFWRAFLQGNVYKRTTIFRLLVDLLKPANFKTTTICACVLYFPQSLRFPVSPIVAQVTDIS